MRPQTSLLRALTLSMKAQLSTSCENSCFCSLVRSRPTLSAPSHPHQTRRGSFLTAACLPPLLRKKKTHKQERHVFGSEAKSKYATHLLFIKYSRCSAEQLLQLSHANVHWLVFLHQSRLVSQRNPQFVGQIRRTSNVTD